MTSLKCADCSSSCILYGLKPEEPGWLSSRMAVLNFKKGDLIFSQGSPVSGCYILCQGKAKLFCYSSTGKKQSLKFLTPGDILAAELLAGKDWYETSAAALEEAQARFIWQAEFFTLLEKHPTVAKQVLQRLADDLLGLEQKLIQRAYESAQERLVALLLELAKSYGMSQAGGVSLSILSSRSKNLRN